MPATPATIKYAPASETVAPATMSAAPVKATGTQATYNPITAAPRLRMATHTVTPTVTPATMTDALAAMAATPGGTFGNTSHNPSFAPLQLDEHTVIPGAVLAAPVTMTATSATFPVTPQRRQLQSRQHLAAMAATLQYQQLHKLNLQRHH